MPRSTSRPLFGDEHSVLNMGNDDFVQHVGNCLFSGEDIQLYDIRRMTRRQLLDRALELGISLETLVPISMNTGLVGEFRKEARRRVNILHVLDGNEGDVTDGAMVNLMLQFDALDAITQPESSLSAKEQQLLDEQRGRLQERLREMREGE